MGRSGTAVGLRLLVQRTERAEQRQQPQPVGARAGRFGAAIGARMALNKEAGRFQPHNLGARHQYASDR